MEVNTAFIKTSHTSQIHQIFLESCQTWGPELFYWFTAPSFWKTQTAEFSLPVKVLKELTVMKYHKLIRMKYRKLQIGINNYMCTHKYNNAGTYACICFYVYISLCVHLYNTYIISFCKKRAPENLCWISSVYYHHSDLEKGWAMKWSSDQLLKVIQDFQI